MAKTPNQKSIDLMNLTATDFDMGDALQLFDGCRLIVVDVSMSPDSVFFAQVVNNDKVRFFGWIDLDCFNRVFHIGDPACFFDGPFFSNVGEIVFISDDGIDISSESSKRRTTLSLSEFIMLNL